MFDEQPDGDPHGECRDEIERLRFDLDCMRQERDDAQNRYWKKTAELEKQVATLQGLEAIANEYGIDGFVEIEEMCKQVMELRDALERIATWDELSIEYRVSYGSQGQQAYYQKVAREALARTAKDE